MNAPYGQDGGRDRDLQAMTRAEQRAERRAAELEALRDEWSSRTITDVLHETMRRGDRVAIQVHPGRTAEGTVVDAGRDYAILSIARKRLAIRTADRELRDGGGDPYRAPQQLVEIRQRARSGGRQASHPRSTFRSVLQRFEFDSNVGRQQVELGSTLRSHSLVGHIQVLAIDHLYLRDLNEIEVFVPLASITYIAWADID